MRNVMKKAWEIAREGQKKFGGKVSEYFAKALKIAWAIVKQVKEKLTLEEIARKIGNKYFNEVNENFDVRVWKNYGKVRIYVNKGFRNNIAMCEFDEEENYIGGHQEMSPMDLFAANEVDHVTNAIQKELNEGTFA